MRQVILLVLSFWSTFVGAQPFHTQAKACVTDEGLSLRWAPMDMQSWQAGIENGYIVERYTIMKDGEILSVEDIAAQKIRTEPIKAKPVEAWEPFSDEKYVAIAAECMYGEKPDMAEGAGGGFSPMMAYRRHRAQQQRFSFALYAADMSPKAAELSGLDDNRIEQLLNSDSKVSQTEWDTIYRNKKNKSNSYKEKIHYDKFITPNYLYFVIKK